MPADLGLRVLDARRCVKRLRVSGAIGEAEPLAVRAPKPLLGISFGGPTLESCFRCLQVEGAGLWSEFHRN